MRDNYYRLGEGFLIVYSITMRGACFLAPLRLQQALSQVNRRYLH